MASERQAEHEAAQGRRVSTLREFASRLAEAAAIGLRETSLESTRLLTQRVLPEHSGALSLAVDEALGQLRRAGTLESDLSRASSERGGLLATALQRSDKRLAALGLRDHRTNAWLARGALAASAIRELDGVRRARVRGVAHFDNADLALIEALHRTLSLAHGGGVVIELPTVPSHLGAAFEGAVGSIAARFERRWASETDHPELDFVEARRGARPPIVIEAAHEASEARAVARAVLEALSRGAALDRIAIVPVEAADAFLEPLRAELAAANLPFSEAWGRPLASAPEAHAALELLRLAEGPLRRDALVDILRVPDLRFSALLGPFKRVHFVDIVERLPVRVDRSGRELLAALEARRLLTDPKHDTELARLRAAEQVLSVLFQRLAHLQKVATRRVFRDRSRELFSELGLLGASRQSLTQAIQYAERMDALPLFALGQNARAGRAIDLALDRVVAAADLLQLNDEPLELRDFHAEFAAALAAIGPSQGAGRTGTLRVARPAEVSGLDWDLLVVCRAASSTLDWQSSSSDGVLDADLIERLPNARRPPTATERASFTRVSLAFALSRTLQPVVTWAKRDARGQSGASRLVLNLSAEDTRSEPASPLDPRARRVLSTPIPNAEVRARANLDLRRQEFYADPNSPLDFGNGMAGPLAPWVGGDAEQPLALTQLERYARCAFLGFSGVVLRTVKDDAVGDGLSARERGTLIHDALAVALTGSRERFGTTDLDTLEREALSRAEEFLRSRVTSQLRRAALGAALDDVAALLRWSFANSDGLWFKEAERAFGKGEAWSSLACGPYFVSGRIDRIDSNTDGSTVRVVDYKTGTVRLAGDHGDELLQPWLYARKVAEEYRAKRVSSGYLSLERRKPNWKAALDEDEPDAIAIRDKVLRAEQLLTSLRAGHVPARPLRPGSCSRCDARDICRRPLSAPHEAGE